MISSLNKSLALAAILLLLLSTYLRPIEGFSASRQSAVSFTGESRVKKTKIVYAKDKDETEKGEESKGIIGGFFDMFANLDDVAEDFFYKRMGKGEIFYGKRKYKPSGDVEGEYNGFGLSDKLKIDMTREYKEAWLEEKRMRDEIRMIREEKERRDSSR
eukprot:CAMPEP_0203696764 /NCGR_PEP_ID=MMETSP0091-20130426/7889_1 /ASSEMBLY_ACC=CAM_ASM_001089 /TAXON_ID=426623 /ORGANISM="Chaetoceros affinis, Strain CCMP159" /LENGTH=158 /DNA_ID=CAMNT_0050568599 /DNA_START=83 /DNA_END=559 /DNA_ORIENTATION=-